MDLKQLTDEELEWHYEAIKPPKISVKAPMMYVSERIAADIIAQATRPGRNS